MRDYIIDILALNERHTRSISLTRDLYEDTALDGYLLTPNSLTALRQIGEGLASGRPQRAWRVVGPYGSGKSALGVMLAQLLAGSQACPHAAKLVASASKTVSACFTKADRLSVAVVGARVSFGSELANALLAAATKLSKSKAVATWKKQIDLEGCTYQGRPLSAVAGKLASDFANLAVIEGYRGLALLIDEVGKFVEYAALHPDQGDLIALQQVAEAACTAQSDKLMVVTMLHQHFASYAAGVGRALSDEWHKVSARFEEVPFDEPVERYAHFAAHALGVSAEVKKDKALCAQATSLYEQAVHLGILRASTAAEKNLFKRAETLYPLHPLVLSTLAVVSKRYGQSERSFHAFIKGHEPKGLREFASKANIPSWYTLPNLYDYLAEGHGLRFRDLSAERRWAYASSAIDRTDLNEQALATLKTIAVLELAQAGQHASLPIDLIAYGQGEADPATLVGTLNLLFDQGVLIRRKGHREYAMAVSEAVNVEALYEQAARANEDALVISGISKALSDRTIVASRHYDETGTIRTMGMLVGTIDSPPSPPKTKGEEPKPDAWLKLLLIPEALKGDERVAIAIQSEQDELTLLAPLYLTSDGRAALAEFAIWQNVQREVTKSRLDPWTSRYVESRIEEAARSIDRLVTSALTPNPDSQGPTYWHCGALIEGSEQQNPNQLASWLFNTVYSQTPRIINELINKDKPASAIVLARQRMFDVILSGDYTRPICRESEFPPERLIHTTLLRDTGLWVEGNGQWRLTNPDGRAPINIGAVWTEISLQLASEDPTTFSDLLTILALPPLGVRAGPAGIWVVLYLLINRSRCAVFERGTLVLELTAEHLQRMYKNPNTFQLRELTNAEASKKLLTDYRAALASVGCTFEAEHTYLEIARVLIRWFARLPDYTKQTQRVSKDAALVRTLLTKATDPIELLAKTVPRCHVESKSKLSLGDWLTNTLTDIGMAHRRLQDRVTDELSRGFSIGGPLGRIRNQLQAECSKEASKLADTKLKSFILRCTDLLLTDEKWLDSVGGLLVQRPLDAWSDDTFSKFQERLTELCGQYRRWMQVVMHRGQAPQAADRFVGLTLTLSGGEEASVFVTTNETSSALAKDLLAMAAKTANGNTELAAAALAQALLDLQTKNKDAVERDVRHG
jgi:hypothetical protein